MPASVPGDVQAWFAAKTAARPGSEVRCNEVYAAYRAWCEGRGETPVSLTKFGTLTKGALGIPYREKSKRGYYVGIEIAPGARLN
jgi:phage/plasmid-associated DNA primase